MALCVVITEPGIDLIFTENPIFFAGGIIIGHDKIAKKAERLLINFSSERVIDFQFIFSSLNLLLST